MIRFAENLNKMIAAGLGGALEAPRTEVAVGHYIRYLEASGPVASFESNIAAPIRSLRVDMLPIQAGSGDPSPENIRPISGRNSVTVTRAGKNLWNDADFALANFRLVTDPEDAAYGYYFGNARNLGFSASSPFSKDNGGLVRKSPIGGTVAVSFDVGRIDSRGYVRFYYEDGTDSGSVFNISSGTIGHIFFRSNPDKNVSTVNFITVGGSTSRLAIKNLQIERGEIETAYEPYDEQSVTVQLGQTVYGGTLDVTNGKLVNEWANIASYDGETLPGEWLSDRDVYVPGTTPTIGAQVCYKLAAPIEITLDPASLSTLQGENNIWSDAGDVTLEYPYYEETEGY